MEDGTENVASESLKSTFFEKISNKMVLKRLVPDFSLLLQSYTI